MSKTKIKLSRYLQGESIEYSGRGMFGRSCPGFIYEDLSSAVADFLSALHNEAYETDFEGDRGQDEFDLLYEELKHVEFDSMGLRTIAYFPYLSAEGVHDKEALSVLDVLE
ncbi:MAG: hypothetical protein WA919_11075 [Coleofasciculaceae cyanobacterium]